MYANNLVDKQAYEKELKSRWDWLTEDIDDEESKINTDIVLENSYKYMVSQGSIPRNWLAENILSEDDETITEAPQRSDTTIGTDYMIPKVMFPIIKRVMPELIANKLVSVQPIQAPTGVIYYITYEYSNTKGTITAKDEFSGNPQQTTPAFATWYSSEKIGPFTATATDTTTAIAIDTGAKVTGFLGTDKTQFVIKRFEVYNTTTGKGLGTVYVDGATTGNTVTYDATTGAITLTADFMTDNKGKISANDVLRVFLVYDQEGSSKIPEMEFTINHMDVSSQERKLKVRWTKEAEQDMMAYHKIDVEAELVKVAAVQTNYEIDRQVINFIGDQIIPELSFSHDWTNDASDATGNNTHGNYLDRHRCLAQKLYRSATQVAVYNHLGPADWAVCSPEVASVLQMLPDWKSGEIGNNKSTFYNAGALGNGALTIYVDPNRTGDQLDEVTLGYKSKDSTYGAGVVYSPYANWMSGTVVNPDNFNNVRGFFNRYALTLAPRGQYNYARLDISNLN
jgi:hypothetical protein